jgi:uncharacterized protein with PQ loop repeat
MLGIVISYLPQHWRICNLKSSHGLSPFYLLMGGLSSYSNVLNALILQSPYMGCCTQVTRLQCFLNLLGFWQLLIQWAMFFIMYQSLQCPHSRARFVLFVIYFPEEEKYEEVSDHLVMTAEWRMSIAATMVVTGYMMVAGVGVTIMLLVKGGESEVAVRAAALLGLGSLSLSLCQFVPQLARTWRLKEAGALSIPALAMQAPGSFVFCYTLAISPGTNVTTWATYFAGGTLQSSLLLLCLCYRHNHPRRHPVAVAPAPVETGVIVSEEEGDGGSDVK